MSGIWLDGERTTTVELEGSLEGDALLGGRALRVCRLGSVKSIDIGLVVLGVVQSHDLLGNERFEGIVSVRKRWELVSHFLQVVGGGGVNERTD